MPLSTTQKPREKRWRRKFLAQQKQLDTLRTHQTYAAMILQAAKEEITFLRQQLDAVDSILEETKEADAQAS